MNILMHTLIEKKKQRSAISIVQLIKGKIQDQSEMQIE